MMYYDLQRFGREKTARFHKEAAVGAIARASARPRIAVTAARALRRLAETIDQTHRRDDTAPVEVAQPTVKLALNQA